MNKKECGSLGGLAKSEKYKDKRRKAIELYITKPDLTLNEIAEKVGGVSYGFVKCHTKTITIKSLKFSRVFENYKCIETLTDEDFETLIEKSNLILQ